MPRNQFGVWIFTSTSFEWWLNHCHDSPDPACTFPTRREAVAYVESLHPDIVWESSRRRDVGHIPDLSVFALVQNLRFAS